MPRWLCGVLVGTLLATSCSSTDAGDQSATTSKVAASTFTERSDWGEPFDDARVEGTIVIREVGSDTTQGWNLERADVARRPASTFKILNAMIILETAVLSDVDTTITWDGTTRSVPDWNRDHSLRTGIDVSAVWLFQELARRVGEQDMDDWVARAAYGNHDIGGGIDRFWLDGELRISPLEQLDFLESMVTDELPFQRTVTDAVQDILVQERGESWSLSYKTGTALVEEPTLGWLVGTTTNDGRTWVFAMNLDLTLTGSGTVAGQIDPQLRQRIAREILVSEGALPAS